MLMKIQVLYMELEIYFSLMQPLCQISKKLYGKRKPCNILSTSLRRQMNPKRYPPYCGVNNVRNSIINIHLPLMIFIRMHSQESQFHNKCLFCSIMSIIYVQIPPCCSSVQYTFQTHDARASPAESTDEKSKKLYYRS